MEKSLIIISGSTAVGKTDYALSYAQNVGAEIVSCDALLVYRGMNIGTAKPSTVERAQVPHHLIDLHPVNKAYNITSYIRDAQVAINDIFARGKSVVITGGSGFYLKSFFSPVVDIIKVSDAVRAEVAKLFDLAGLDGLLSELYFRSPQGVGNLDLKNPRRVMRALERCIASGRPLPEIQSEFAARPEPYADHRKYFVLLERDIKNLKQRVVRRAENMLQKGLIDEVEVLLKKGIRNNPSAICAIGYRETIAFLDGEIKREDLLSTIIQNTMCLVKKQKTWLRTQIRTPDELVNF